MAGLFVEIAQLKENVRRFREQGCPHRSTCARMEEEDAHDVPPEEAR
jgi:hypothetical protein